MKKSDLDNRSRQLNPQHPAYWSSRDTSPPSAPPSEGLTPTPAAPKKEQ